MSTARDATAEYVAWFVALTGLWIAASAELYGASGATYNNNLIAGLIVAVAAGFVAYRLRTG